ncbi:hypothetical protein ILYODFUR_021247 [Ilyodon furcidens]|uniref:Uncharacterized protein n=1 Tax=Ilyodon furcidens TaxID=33524 RepID=A0ABV0V4X8_9TELE
MCTQDTSLFAHQTTWRVRMALPKMLRFAVIFFVVCYTLDKPGFRQSLSILFEEMTAIKSPSIHVREKRETPTDFTDYDLKVVISLSDLAVLQSILNNLSFPIPINNSTEISNIHATTGLELYESFPPLGSNTGGGVKVSEPGGVWKGDGEGIAKQKHCRGGNEKNMSCREGIERWMHCKENDEDLSREGMESEGEASEGVRERRIEPIRRKTKKINEDDDITVPDKKSNK